MKGNIMKVGDKVNLVVAFMNKDENFEKDNIFTFDNIKLIDTLYLRKDVFCTERLLIEVNNPHPIYTYIPKLGFSFRIQEENLEKLDYEQSYFCYLIASIKNDSYTLKHELIKLLVDQSYEELEDKKKKIIFLEKQINVLTKLLNEE